MYPACNHRFPGPLAPSVNPSEVRRLLDVRVLERREDLSAQLIEN